MSAGDRVTGDGDPFGNVDESLILNRGRDDGDHPGGRPGESDDSLQERFISERERRLGASHPTARARGEQQAVSAHSKAWVYSAARSSDHGALKPQTVTRPSVVDTR